jgi:hypothetical protein
VAANPVPIFGKRIVAVFDRMPANLKISLRQKSFSSGLRGLFFGWANQHRRKGDLFQNFGGQFAGKIFFGRRRKMPINSAAFSFSLFRFSSTGSHSSRQSCDRGEQPVLPFGRFGGGKFFELGREPAGGVGRVCE